MVGLILMEQYCSSGSDQHNICTVCVCVNQPVRAFAHV